MFRLRFPEPKLSPETIAFLAQKQAEIDNLPDYETKRTKVGDKWKGKAGSKAGKAAFEEVRSKLLSATVSEEICNYCEHNEASDVEHVAPKSLFPEKTFVFENYILACKKCNQLKIDKCSVFHPDDSTKIIDLTNDNKTQPICDHILWINPHTEEPLEYLQLLIETDYKSSTHLYFVPTVSDPNSADYHKAMYVIKELKLNTRNGLVEQRKNAFRSFLNLLGICGKINKAKTHRQLRIAINGHPAILKNQSIASEKERLIGYFRELIQSHIHPSVWQEMKRQHKNFKFLEKLFEAAPEALDF